MLIMNYKKRFGQEGEAAVAKYLEESEYDILARNFSINHKIGEIDIIAKKSHFSFKSLKEISVNMIDKTGS